MWSSYDVNEADTRALPVTQQLGGAANISPCSGPLPFLEVDFILMTSLILLTNDPCLQYVRINFMLPETVVKTHLYQ